MRILPVPLASWIRLPSGAHTYIYTWPCSLGRCHKYFPHNIQLDLCHRAFHMCMLGDFPKHLQSSRSHGGQMFIRSKEWLDLLSKTYRTYDALTNITILGTWLKIWRVIACVIFYTAIRYLFLVLVQRYRLINIFIFSLLTFTQPKLRNIPFPWAKRKTFNTADIG